MTQALPVILRVSLLPPQPVPEDVAGRLLAELLEVPDLATLVDVAKHLLHGGVQEVVDDLVMVRALPDHGVQHGFGGVPDPDAELGLGLGLEAPDVALRHGRTVPSRGCHYLGTARSGLVLASWFGKGAVRQV